MTDTPEPFDTPVRAVPDDDVLLVALGAWEGPLDLLLTLARNQKVDLAQISILALVDQYLAFINRARRVRLELAADYLVMAAWLAYLKSCLLLPKEAQDEPSAEELALRLQMQLQRLEAMRDAGARLLARDRIGRDIFLRGAPEGLRVERTSAYDCTLYELLKAYGDIRQRGTTRVYAPQRRPVLALDDAIARLGALLGTALDWTEIAQFLPASEDPEYRRSALASTFVAALELARQGKARLVQTEAFGPLHLRGGA
jgi:segregation and condensation protein A